MVHCIVVYAVRNSLNQNTRKGEKNLKSWCTVQTIKFYPHHTSSYCRAQQVAPVRVIVTPWVQLTQLQQIDWTIKRSCNVRALFRGVTLDLTELSVVWKATGYVTQGSPAAIIHRSRLLPLFRFNSLMIEMDSHIFLVILILTSQFKFVIYCSRFT